jgi:hypothetical protein
MLFKVFLVLMVCALALFFAGLVLATLALHDLAEAIDTLGADTLLAGFVFVLLLGVVYALKAATNSVMRFFSATEIMRRKVLFTLSKKRELEQRHTNELLQVHYFNAIKRARLLHVNECKHVRLLSIAIYRQLGAARANMPLPLYRYLKKAIRVCCRRLDGDALLLLQKQIGVYK